MISLSLSLKAICLMTLKLKNNLNEHLRGSSISNRGSKMEMDEYYEWFLEHDGSTNDRDSKWKELRDLYLREHPSCASCGATTKLQIHHCIPISEGGTDDWSNLITLCMGGRYKGLVCHFVIGHRLDWHLHNPFVREDAARMLDRVTKRRDRKLY